jgi:hypothetical protein
LSFMLTVIIGSAIGAVLLLLFAFFLYYCCYKRHQYHRTATQAQVELQRHAEKMQGPRVADNYVAGSDLQPQKGGEGDFVFDANSPSPEPARVMSSPSGVMRSPSAPPADDDQVEYTAVGIHH